MRARVSLVRVVWVLLVAILVAGCRASGQKEFLAEMIRLSGRASRDYASQPGAFTPAVTGATFGLGDGLRTDLGAEAHLRLRRGGTLDVRENTLIRFLADTPAARRVRLETGTAEIEPGVEGMVFETGFGTARIDPGARVRLSAEDKEARFEVLIGAAVFESEGKSAQTLRAGQPPSVWRAGEDAGLEEPDVGAPQTDAMVDDPSAIVAEVKSAGVSRAAPRSKTLLPLGAGTTRLDPGSRLVLANGAKVSIRRGAELATVSGAADILVGTSSGALIETRTGRVGIDTTPAVIRIDVPGGTITVRGTLTTPSSAELVLAGAETDVFSRAGTTELRGRKSSAALNGREAAWLDANGVVQKSIVTNEVPLFALPAGETATIHSLRVPTPVLLRVDDACGSGAYLEVAHAGRFLPVGLADAGEYSASQSQRTVVLSLGEGSHAYRVRCPDRTTAGPTGTFRIVRDSGGAHLPRSAGHNAVHADGRRYSVLYQNLLPELTLDWPDAPVGEALTLKLRRGGNGLDEVPLRTPSYSFASGKLGDGTYTFWFEVQRDPRLRSFETTVRIGFDNAAPAAEIHEPQDGFTPTDGKILVSGVAVEGVTVRVGDTNVPIDAQFRFRGDVPVIQGDRSIAIRIEHPTRGVHYYVRRIGGT